MYKTMQVSPEVHETLKKSSEKSGLPIKRLVELLVTVNMNWLNSPEKIGEKMSMVTGQKIIDVFSKDVKE